MAFLLSLSGRCIQAQKHLDALACSQTATMHELALLADFERPIEQRDFLESCSQRNPDDKIVAIGLAAHDFGEGHAGAARRQLDRIIADSPENLDAQAMLGELLLDRSSIEFLSWYQELTPSAKTHAGIWYVSGIYARKSGDLPLATKCLQHALSLAPSHRRAVYQLSQVASSLKATNADALAEYAETLLKLSEAVDQILRSDGQDEQQIHTVVQLLQAAGRYREACAWSVVASKLSPQPVWSQDFLSKYRSYLSETFPRVAKESIPWIQVPKDSLPGFDQLKTNVEQHSQAVTASIGQNQISFAEATSTVEFVYQNGHDSQTPGARMFEQTGGGVVAGDFDSDGWTDLFFPQGGQWDAASRQFSRNAFELDTLYRNRQGDFDDVSALSLPADIGFGQGGSAGDYDNDGFQDLYVGNIGKNQLLTNMGDGTFTDDSDGLARRPPEVWTASTAITDLNGDGNAELIDINYLQGEGIYFAICGGKACSPSVFDAAMDHIAVSYGDGTFEVIDGSAKSKGLGSVILRLSDGPEMSLFISNDQVANVLLTFNQRNGNGLFNFTEQALQAGLAVNEDGLSMGCMGIATADVTGNGLTDIFVSNFKDESNTLYIQDAPGFFVDRTRTTGLSAPGLPLVGWGTQFLDANLDGLPDLVVANGHVDDYRDDGGEYEMPTSFYQNLGQAEFREFTGNTAGEFFERRHVGRGLARFDGNQDGAMDFVVSNIGDRASVVTNDSMDRGHFINVQLRATGSQRDAIGANATLMTDDRISKMQLTSGDGYMASNERTLQFGLGNTNRADELTITWPSGATTILQSPPVDSVFLIVEGRQSATVSKGGRLTSFPLSFTVSQDN